MQTFYHTGKAGDIIYSLPTVAAMGGGRFVCGMPKQAAKALGPLMLMQASVRQFIHESDTGLPLGFFNLSRFREHPHQGMTHLVQAHADMQSITPAPWREGWLRTGGIPEISWFNFRGITMVPYAVINVTPRYRDKCFRWSRELSWLFRRVQEVYFLGDRQDYEAERFHRYKSGIFGQNRVRYIKTDDLLDATYIISGAQFFSGSQSALLAIRQGLGLPYRMEQSPNHFDTRQDSPLETIINPITRRIHLAAVCAKKAILDLKISQQNA